MRAITRISVLLTVLMALASCAGKQESQQTTEGKVHTFTVALANVHVVDVSGVRLMIDSGKAGNEPALIELMEEAGIAPSSIDYLILTHGHTDHAGGAAFFKREFGTKIVAGTAEEPMLATGHNDDLCSTGMIGSLLKSSIMRERYPAVVPDIAVNDGFDLAEIGARGVIMAAPSHTPGSIAVLVDNKAFVGDLVRGGLVNNSLPARHFYMCDLNKNDADIKRLLGNEQIVTWYPGHMGPLDVAAVKDEFATSM